MYGIQVDQDVCCRSVGRCTFGAHLDREMMDLVPRQLREGMTVEEQYAAPTIALQRRSERCRSQDSGVPASGSDKHSEDGRRGKYPGLVRDRPGCDTACSDRPLWFLSKAMK